MRMHPVKTFLAPVSKFDQDDALSTAVTNVLASDAVRPFNNCGGRMSVQSYKTILLDFESIHILQ